MRRGQRRLAAGVSCPPPGERRGAGPAASEPASLGRRRARGAALVEFAIALPVLLVILLGIIDLGRVFYAYEALANAAREGARVCALTRTCDDAEAEARVKLELADWITVTQVRVNYSDPGRSMGSPVTVTAASTFELVTPLMSEIVGGDVDLEVSATMSVW